MSQINSTGARQVLSFQLGGETYAVDILRVVEIRGYSPVTRIPETPHHMLGVLNLRGNIVPTIDMRRRIGIEAVEPSALTVVVVLSVESNRGRRDFGLVVDGVSDVLDIPGENIRPAPDVVNTHGEELVNGLAQVNDRMVLLLDIDRMLGGETVEVAAAA
ncbi:purine-binding chemotaxis protein CheW [Povalibacter uvarum]|uniref:Chemotaxis protein CheW n=1 Tax=Povalibacter uvarum TaxID=732238 RepID=A0A841HUS1_9GAMM|nr:chemotaxis protein CheW [Povalibacter uvarum]MBB6096404.1 purine-binding chemotaxis protein CheW [Povalibacter uvarum]